MSDFDALAHLKGLCRDDHYLGEDDLDEDWEVVEDDDDWTQDGKYQHSSAVVKHSPTGRHFAIHNSRSGSYHSDWYYSTPEVTEVVAQTKTITITEWVKKK